MKTRAITGLFFVIVMLVSVSFGPYCFLSFYLLLSIFTMVEFFHLVRKADIQVSLPEAIIGGACIFCSMALHQIVAFDTRLLLINVPVICGIFISELFRKSAVPFTVIGHILIGYLYTILPFCFFVMLGFVNGPFNYHYPLAFMLLLWANDTGAYMVGIKFGHTKLFERHSPKKTWEGLAGGVLFSIAIAFAISHYFKDISLTLWVSVAIMICIFGTLGDLVESMFKRSMNTKDSGSLLPGHGGLLDRFDGFLMAAPIIFTYLYLITN